ncbi:hypothetical protein EBZ38_07450 [bacterium]|nr:hypothetical protein [bacterium]
MTNIVSFPESKAQEKIVRELQSEGVKLHLLTEELNMLIDDWTARYIKEGTKYIEQGGNDPEILTSVEFLRQAQKVFGIFK